MKLALVHPDASTDPWVQLVRSGTRHSFVEVYGTAEQAADAGGEHFPADQWERLLHADNVEAVMVGAAVHSDQRAELLLRFVQAGVALLVPHPAAGMLDCFSLQMTQTETHALIFPLIPEWDGGAIDRLRRWLDEPEVSPIGVIEQIGCERPLGSRDRQTVTCQFAIDAFLLRRLLGGMRKLAAVGIEPPDPDWSRLHVQMLSRSGIPTSWGSVGSSLKSTASWTLQGSQGSALVTIHPLQPWQLSIGGAKPEIAGPSPIPDTLIDQAADAIAAGSAREELWDDACRSLELADVIESSARRGKTIELHDVEVTEAGTFRGMMATGGCLLLLATVALSVLLGSVDSIWSIGGTMRYAPWVIVAAALIVFLGLQLLNLAFPRHTDTGKETDRTG